MDLIKFCQENILNKKNINYLAKKYNIEFKYNFSPESGDINFLLLKNAKSIVVMHLRDNLVLSYTPAVITSFNEGNLASAPASELFPYYIGTRITLYHHDNDWKISTPNAFLADELKWMEKTYKEIIDQLILNKYEDTLDPKYSYSFLIESRALNIYVEDERAILVDVRESTAAVPAVLAAHPLADKSYQTQIDEARATLKEAEAEKSEKTPIEEDVEKKEDNFSPFPLSGQIDNFLNNKPYVLGYIHRRGDEITVYPSDLGKLIADVANNPIFAPVDTEKKRKYILTRIVFEQSSLALDVLQKMTTHNAPLIEEIQKMCAELRDRVNRTTLQMLRKTETRIDPVSRYVSYFMANYKKQIYSLLGSTDGASVIDDYIRDVDDGNIKMFIETLGAAEAPAASASSSN